MKPLPNILKIKAHIIEYLMTSLMKNIVKMFWSEQLWNTPTMSEVIKMKHIADR